MTPINRGHGNKIQCTGPEVWEETCIGGLVSLSDPHIATRQVPDHRATGLLWVLQWPLWHSLSSLPSLLWRLQFLFQRTIFGFRDLRRSCSIRNTALCTYTSSQAGCTHKGEPKYHQGFCKERSLSLCVTLQTTKMLSLYLSAWYGYTKWRAEESSMSTASYHVCRKGSTNDLSKLEKRSEFVLN